MHPFGSLVPGQANIQPYAGQTMGRRDAGAASRHAKRGNVYAKRQSHQYARERSVPACRWTRAKLTCAAQRTHPSRYLSQAHVRRRTRSRAQNLMPHHLLLPLPPDKQAGSSWSSKLFEQARTGSWLVIRDIALVIARSSAPTLHPMRSRPQTPPWRAHGAWQ